MSDSNRSGFGGIWVLGLWALTIALAYAGLGGWLAEGVEGIDPSSLPTFLPLLTGLGLLVSITVTIVWARGRTPEVAEGAPAPTGLGRRRFITGAAATVGGIAGVGAATIGRVSGWALVTGPALGPETIKTDPNPRAEWKGSRVQSYRRLGRTGFEVSDIALGSGKITEENDGEAIAREAIERGVNYFDTAPDYSGSSSEKALGHAIKGRRDKMFLATKFCRPTGHIRQGSSVREYMEAVEASLVRLQTDYVDLVHIHSCDTVERLLDENAHEAFSRLKQQGKARFMGVTSHTPNLEEVANAALESNRFDVMMFAYHHGAWPEQAGIIDRAKAQDIGIVAMKTLKGALHHGLAGFREDADAFSQAAFKWVLSNPSVACLVISFFEHQHLDEYLYASGKALTKADTALLERYDDQIAGKHCYAQCGECLDSCPENLAINNVLRHRMYFENYGTEKDAIEHYARLDKQADRCIGCSANCAGSCPHGVPIQERMIGAHRMLTLNG